MKVVIIVLFVLLGLYIILSLALFLLACRRFRGNRVPSAATDNSTDKAWKKFSDVIKPGIEWFKAQEKEPVEIRSFDGLTLRASVLPAENPKGILIVFHGYRSSPMRDLGASVKYYHGLGYTLVLPCQRACGESDGKYITFGVKERRDVQAWARWAAGRYPDAPIALAGISLGASSVLMALGLEMPKNVRAAVADCGYGSIYEELKCVLKKFFGLPPQPLLGTVDLWCRLFAGFGIHDCDVPEILRKNAIPVLFFHGEADDFVPTRFSRENYDACTAPKAILTVPEASHGLSYLVDTEGYHRELEAFLDKYCTVKGENHVEK